MKDIYKVNPESVKTVEWNDDPRQYDLDLFDLGENHDEFMVLNPWIEDQHLYHYIDNVPNTDKCVVWIYNNEWVAKYFTDSWSPKQGYKEIEIVKPKFIWRKNQDLDRTMTFEDDPFAVYEPEPWDSQYELVWYMDPRFNPLPDRVWALSCKPIGKICKGTKDMGYVTPQVDIEYTQYLPKLIIDIDKCYPAYFDLAHECAWQLDNAHRSDELMWIVKFTPRYRKPKPWKWYGTISPAAHVEYNPVLPKLNYELDYIVPWHDLAYEHVWMLDRQHLQNGEDDIWAFKIRYTTSTQGVKNVDYISPISTVVFNTNLPKLNYDLDYIVPWHDLAYEHVWALDTENCPNNEDIWAFKIRYTKSKKGNKYVDYISPISTIIVNPDFEGSNFELSEIPYYDFQYENIWMLEDRWAVKETFVEKPQGEKYVGNVVYNQRMKFNPALKNLYVDIDYRILDHDRFYEHVWYTEIDQQKIWAAKLTASDYILGTKEMGTVVAEIPQQLDVVFISYGEINADENWQRVLSKAPAAKRIDGVTGILEAHQEAANLVSTDMFYVVDGDAYLDDNWTFDFQPSIYDRECTHVWHSINPITGASYGYGGVKLFHTLSVKKLENWKTDLTMSVSKKLKVIETVSNITKFNTSEFNTWRSAFRECAKLFKSKDPESSARLEKWLNPNDVEFASWAKLGAKQGVDYAKNNLSIKDVNNYCWLLEHFRKLNGRR